jgi:hypothetical protein
VSRCKFCGCPDSFDGGLNKYGEFICIDCIAENPDANEELTTMQPVNPWLGKYIDYPSECYDVNRFKHHKNNPKEQK